MKEGIVDKNEIINIVNEIEEEHRTIKELKKDYPEKIERLGETLEVCISENDLIYLKTEFLQ